LDGVSPVKSVIEFGANYCVPSVKTKIFSLLVNQILPIDKC